MHPPLPPIALHVFWVVFGRFGPFILSQLCVGLTLWLVWLTACRLVSRDRALIGTVLKINSVASRHASDFLSFFFMFLLPFKDFAI